MKVLLLHPPMYPVNHEFYNILAEKVNLVVYQICEYPNYHTDWTNEKIRTGKVNYKLKILSRGILSFKKTLNPLFLIDIISEKPDIVLSIAFWMPSFYISMLKNIGSFKFIILTNAVPRTEVNLSISKKIIRKFIGRNVDVFISASHLTTKYLKSFYPNNKIILSMQTINVLKWQENLDLLESKKILLKKLNLPNEKKLMLGIGNYIKKKNWKSVIEIIKNTKDIFFILIGAGEEKSEYELIIEKQKLKDKILIVGKKEGNELLEYYKVSDFLIFPSFYDQFGFVVPEALAAGLPVICTENAGSSSLIINGVNGYLINPKKYDKTVIENMLSNINMLSNNAKNSVAKYTLENRVEEFIEIFNIQRSYCNDF